MNYRDQVTPGNQGDAVMMVSVSLHTFTHGRPQRRGPLAQGHPENFITESEPGLPPCPVIRAPSSPFLTPTPRPNARTQKQLLEMASPDPRVVQEGAGLEGTRQDIKLTAPLEWPWH